MSKACVVAAIECVLALFLYYRGLTVAYIVIFPYVQAPIACVVAIFAITVACTLRFGAVWERFITSTLSYEVAW